MTTWTAHDDELLIAMVNAGDSGATVARAFDRTRNAVVDRAHRLGVKFKGAHGGHNKGKKAAPSPRTTPAKPRKPTARLHPGNIAGKREGRTHDPVFREPIVTAVAAPRMVKLVDLKAEECKFPIGDPRDDGFGFCGHARIPGSPYCSGHHRVAFNGTIYQRAAA